jgi:Nitroreductase family
MTNRRHVLALLAAAPFAPSCTPSNLPDPIAAWRDPGAGETDPRRFALAHAILAPNPHNTQPWLVELDGADGMTLYCDLDRRLPFTDPLDRQITLGCGAFLQLYMMAVGQWEVDLFPEGAPEAGQRLDARPIARVRNRPGLNPSDPLAAHISARRTNRNPYDSRIPAVAALQTLADAAIHADGMHVSAHVESEPARVVQIRDLVWRAFEREMHTQGALEETFAWLRFGREAIARHRDGLAIDGPLIPLFKAAGLFSHDAMVNPDSTSNKQALRDWRHKAETAPAFMWLTTPDDTPTSRLIAGMAYARMNLAATATGLAMHPWSQALQEYEAMSDLYAEAKTLLGVEDQTLQMLVRVGYADAAPPAARRGVQAILRA